MKRSHLELQATPRWENPRDTNAIYLQAALMRERGVPVTVDHIYPLQGVDVCGLNWYKNMQIVAARDNSGKNNRCAMVQTYPLWAEQESLF